MNDEAIFIIKNKLFNVNHAKKARDNTPIFTKTDVIQLKMK